MNEEMTTPAHQMFFILSLNLLLSSMNKVELSQSKKQLFGVSLTLLERFLVTTMMMTVMM